MDSIKATAVESGWAGQAEQAGSPEASTISEARVSKQDNHPAAGDLSRNLPLCRPRGLLLFPMKTILREDSAKRAELAVTRGTTSTK